MVTKVTHSEALKGRTFLVQPNTHGDRKEYTVYEKLSNMNWAMLTATLPVCTDLAVVLRAKGARVGVQLEKDGVVEEMR